MSSTKYGFIYMTINKINGMKYIGKRKYYGAWQNYLGSGKLLKRAIKKYGKENFERIILAEADTKEELDGLEKYYIEIYNAVDSEEFYNFKPGGEGGNGLKGVNHPLYGKQAHNANKEIIICENIMTGEKLEFTNITNFAKKYGFIPSKIINVLQGKRASHKGCLFYYKKDGHPKNLNYKDCRPIIRENLETGEKTKITNVRKFCQEHNISNAEVWRCLNGTNYQSNGYIYYREGDFKPYKPQKVYIAENIETGEIIEFTNVMEFAKRNNFTYQRIYACLNGTQKSGIHKGYKFYEKQPQDNPEPSLVTN